MSEKHIGEVVQVTGPVLDIRFPEGELPRNESSRHGRPDRRSGRRGVLRPRVQSAR